jgi:hypothetical protein
MIFGVTAKKLISHDDAAAQGSLWRCFDACTRGLLAFPLRVPGTAFYKCMQAANFNKSLRITVTIDKIICISNNLVYLITDSLLTRGARRLWRC